MCLAAARREARLAEPTFAAGARRSRLTIARFAASARDPRILDARGHHFRRQGFLASGICASGDPAAAGPVPNHCGKLGNPAKIHFFVPHSAARMHAPGRPEPDLPLPTDFAPSHHGET